MKIYTKTGDGGETSLYGGERRSKSNIRVATYGDVDELQALLGVVLANISQEILGDVKKDLQEIQLQCFTLASQLARTETKKARRDPSIQKENIEFLENCIDGYEVALPQLRAFIMQGGSVGGAFLHQSRAICRRAERSMVSLSHEEAVDDLCLKYINRLSDLLFVMARTVNHRLGEEEIEWHAR